MRKADALRMIEEITQLARQIKHPSSRRQVKAIEAKLEEFGKLADPPKEGAQPNLDLGVRASVKTKVTDSKKE